MLFHNNENIILSSEITRKLSYMDHHFVYFYLRAHPVFLTISEGH